MSPRAKGRILIVCVPAPVPPPTSWEVILVVKMMLELPAPAFAPKFVPRKRTVAPELLTRLLNVTTAPPAPGVTVTVLSPALKVRLPTDSADAPALPIKLKLPPFIVRASVLLKRPSTRFVPLLSRVSEPPDMVKAEESAVPEPLKVRVPA